jgi:hypothetical protein
MKKTRTSHFSQKDENHPTLEIISHPQNAFAIVKLQETNLSVPT